MQQQTDVDLANVVQFILEIDKLKGVLRKVRPSGETRFENAAEHSWQLAVLAFSLADTLDLTLDINRVVAMLLVHDIGEIDTGDALVFLEGGWDERKAAELAAVKRIFGLAPDRTGTLLLALWQEFEVGDTMEARFARSIDRSMPVLLNLTNGGGSWLENGVTYEKVIRRVGPEVEGGCPELWVYLKRQLEAVRHKGFFADTAS